MSATHPSPLATNLVGAPCRVNPLRRVNDPPDSPGDPSYDAVIVAVFVTPADHSLRVVVSDRETGSTTTVPLFAIRIDPRWLEYELHPPMHLKVDGSELEEWQKPIADAIEAGTRVTLKKGRGSDNIAAAALAAEARKLRVPKPSQGEGA